MQAPLLVIGYGNPARGDDGLGPAFLDALASDPVQPTAHAGDVAVPLRLLCDFQLAVEHASDVAGASRVVFVDAMLSNHAERYTPRLQPMQACDEASVTSHALTPAAVLALADTLYDARPPAWILPIAGAHFGDVHEGLSAQAEANLAAALSCFRTWLMEG